MHLVMQLLYNNSQISKFLLNLNNKDQCIGEMKESISERRGGLYQLEHEIYKSNLYFCYTIK